jgi:hypothetical protein
VTFAHWLRANSEHYLLADAQARMAAKYGLSAPRPPRGADELFWRRLFVPVYRLLPWRLRRSVIQLMPGSHRRAWSPAPTRGEPAI